MQDRHVYLKDHKGRAQDAKEWVWRAVDRALQGYISINRGSLEIEIILGLPRDYSGIRRVPNLS
ncbi:hypothetical protein SAMD00023353_2800950 [Rosellinia necatrix]|uniref:Uncharacterized protein n=1 Tax=Rosellinia necatrix TaxID=77044 RepID=A0A1S8A8F3_ROSNE|nr:hypothetical protein SAMD00023353_2800950 [Rosellinia necatrix]